jgi:hypothetical protein
MRVVPARFSLWLAVKKKGSAARVSPILENAEGNGGAEANRDFWIPVHKIFSGGECLSGLTLSVSFSRRLLNIKIQRVHEFLKTVPLPIGFPYVLEDGEIGDLSIDPEFGPGWLVPTVHSALVAPAIKDGKPVTYRVTPGRVDAFATFATTGKPGFPEYVHARTRVKDGVFEDLNAHEDVIAEMKKKAYDALHYVDFTGEGWVEANLGGLSGNTVPIISAYALVSAPDFFPASGQYELSEWSRSADIPPAFRGSLWNVNPTPLSEVRLPANLRLPGTPFKRDDKTITAVVGMGAPSLQANSWPAQSDPLRVSALPDDAAGVFAPGWDVSTDRTSNGTRHLAAYALGSPFPEDAKLCAALSTFWPAVAPDIFRTFVNIPGNKNGTIAPLTDAEIGQSGILPWDGIPGPKVVESGGKKFVEYPAFLNVDYVQQALQNRFSMRVTAGLTSDKYQERILASCRAYSVLAGLGDLVAARDEWLMLSFREVLAGDPELQRAQTDVGYVLRGSVYAMTMCRLNVPTERISARLERMPLVDPADFYVTATDVNVLARLDGSPKFSKTRSEP